MGCLWAAQCTICLFPHKNVRATRLGWGDGSADLGFAFIIAGLGSTSPHRNVRTTRLRWGSEQDGCELGISAYRSWPLPRPSPFRLRRNREGDGSADIGFTFIIAGLGSTSPHIPVRTSRLRWGREQDGCELGISAYRSWPLPLPPPHFGCAKIGREMARRI